jgi:transcriptional regulator with XRE-family HTH domain
MPPRKLGSLGAMVRAKRGDAKLRESAGEIGISPATLLRVESGRIPDVATFGKLCHWLGVDPGSFLGYEQKEAEAPEMQPNEEKAPEMLFVSAHLKVDQTPKKETIDALAKMILLAARGQRGSEDVPQNEDA